jgi:hypothetical protein
MNRIEEVLIQIFDRVNVETYGEAIVLGLCIGGVLAVVQALFNFIFKK